MVFLCLWSGWGWRFGIFLQSHCWMMGLTLLRSPILMLLLGFVVWTLFQMLGLGLKSLDWLIMRWFPTSCLLHPLHTSHIQVVPSLIWYNTILVEFWGNSSLIKMSWINATACPLNDAMKTLVHGTTMEYWASKVERVLVPSRHREVYATSNM